MAAFNYCKKSESRLEGPWEHGLPPAARQVRGAKKELLEMCREHGPEWAVENGHFPI